MFFKGAKSERGIGKRGIMTIPWLLFDSKIYACVTFVI